MHLPAFPERWLLLPAPRLAPQPLVSSLESISEGLVCSECAAVQANGGLGSREAASEQERGQQHDTNETHFGLWRRVLV